MSFDGLRIHQSSISSASSLLLLIIYILYIKEACLSVCLFVSLFGFGAQTTGGISTKFGMEHPLVSVSYLEILFWVDPPRGGIILEKLN